MKKLVLSVVLAFFALTASAAETTTNFNQTLKVTRDTTFAGCKTVADGYIFNSTVYGWNLPVSNCQAGIIIDNVTGSLTAGQFAPRGSSTFQISEKKGETFSVKSFNIKMFYSSKPFFVYGTNESGVVTTLVFDGMTTFVDLANEPGFDSLTSFSVFGVQSPFSVNQIVLDK